MSARVYSDSVLVWEKNNEPIQGLDVSRWSEKRVQIDYSNRLVFYSLKKEDEGHYRCIVNLEIAAMYHVEGPNCLCCFVSRVNAVDIIICCHFRASIFPDSHQSPN